MMLPWTTKWTWDTGFYADSVEWCPVEPYRHVFVCGTYQLVEGEVAAQDTKQKRLGRIYLFTVDKNTTELNPVQTIETSGILDQKWCYHTINNHPILAVATSDGNLQLYKLVEKETLFLEFYSTFSLGEDILALSLDWSSNKTCEDPKIVVSDSAGNITVFKVVCGSLEQIGKWTGHGFEAWKASFNYWNPQVFYSGGDDCIFKSYDLRVPDVAATTNKSHDAGVTAIRSNVGVEHALLTGSYNEDVRLWDARMLKCCTSEANVEGGVWRLKWHPYRHSIILAACMHSGFRILDSKNELKVLGEYKKHESLAYGADWKFEDGKPLMVATCSFYDSKLHVSEIDLQDSL